MTSRPGPPKEAASGPVCRNETRYGHASQPRRVVSAARQAKKWVRPETGVYSSAKASAPAIPAARFASTAVRKNAHL